MWTLVLFTLYGNPNSEVGMSANVTILEHFTTQKFCLDAEKAHVDATWRDLLAALIRPISHDLADAELVG